MLNIALPKGRLGDKVFAMMQRAGYDCAKLGEGSRKLVIEDREHAMSYFLVKPADVAIYVERGAADVGVVGKDILLESDPDIYELLDLRLGICRMAVAGPADFKETTGAPIRIATKFPNIARDFYSAQNREIELIKLSGSIELAPILGLSDLIVDIVETGGTLKANGLRVLEEILPISARLIVNKASYKFKGGQIDEMVAALAKEVADA